MKGSLAESACGVEVEVHAVAFGVAAEAEPDAVASCDAGVAVDVDGAADVDASEDEEVPADADEDVVSDVAVELAPVRATEAGSTGVGATLPLVVTSAVGCPAASGCTVATGVAALPGARLKAPCVESTATSSGIRPMAGISHHQRQRGVCAPRVERTTWVRRGFGGE
jgi:hypothetical protein